MSPPADKPYRLRYTQRGVLWLACALAAGGLFIPSWTARVASAVLALAIAGALWWQARTRPILWVGDAGLRVEVAGQVRLQLSWDEIRVVRADAGEHALFVDAGSPARNVLVPPERGYAFVWEPRVALYDDIVARAGAKVELVERLETLTR